ncbi:MAG: response regulator [Lachnospiraceae bacterium]|nr:response regulator [Lachnospiraceae bacterium]
MELLKLVIVDDEPILLQGLIETYDWEEMGFQVVGTAQSGEQAIGVIQDKRPHVVLTDIRMKQITGLMVMEEVHKMGIDCLFIVLSAYRDFEYAQQACELGAYAYLLKPIEDDKLRETMQGAYNMCMEQIKNEQKYESWEKLLVKDSTSFLQVIVQKYAQNRIPCEKAEEVFATLGNVIGERECFITVCVDIDLAYKITNSLDYEASRFSVKKLLEEMIGEQFFFWEFENEDGNSIFIVRTDDNGAVHQLKRMLESVKKTEKLPVVAAISKPYGRISGIRRSYEEAGQLFLLASASGASAFTISENISESRTDNRADNRLDNRSESRLENRPEGTSEGIWDGPEDKGERNDPSGAVTVIVNAVRKNAEAELKDAFVYFVYALPRDEEQQKIYIHKIMLQTEMLVKDTYGMTREMQEKFQNFYSNLVNLTVTKALDVCYKILQSVIIVRREQASKDETRYFKEYISVAVAYIEEHLDDEELSIVSVASHIYLNPVYFGRVFKNTFNMTFKKYLLQRRMEKAKRLLEEGNESIGSICEQVGISNPSYFSHLFKQYTGKLPSEYKKEYEV